MLGKEYIGLLTAVSLLGIALKGLYHRGLK
jgi:hypothetical protein